MSSRRSFRHPMGALSLRRAIVAATAALLLTGLASPALAIDYRGWFWTTAGDANPLPFDECVRRAPGAIGSQGLTASKSGNNPVYFDATRGGVSVTMWCIGEPKGFYMTLVVMNDDPSQSATNIGNAINTAFWGTTSSAAPPPAFGTVGGRWSLGSNCSWAPPGGWQAIISLNQDPNGVLSGTVLSDNNNTGSGGITILANASGYGNANPAGAQSVFSGNTMSLILHPNSWISVLQLTGQLNGNQISGSVHHYGNDDCTFTMVRS